jgi:hypothetical protein
MFISYHSVQYNKVNNRVEATSLDQEYRYVAVAFRKAAKHNTVPLLLADKESG